MLKLTEGRRVFNEWRPTAVTYVHIKLYLTELLHFIISE